MVKRRTKIVKVIFGRCQTCGKPNTPNHTCRIKFTARNASNLKKRRGE